MTFFITFPSIFLLSLAVLSILPTTPASAASTLYAGQSLNPGQSLTQGNYSFIMQQDCNLVLYDKNRAVWSTETSGRASGCVLRLQINGNLIIYSGVRVIWQSNSSGFVGIYYLILQTDRNVVIYDFFHDAIWSTGTEVPSADSVDDKAAPFAVAKEKVVEIDNVLEG
ncbi:mannose-specific lectin-like [Phalaenopsis equestris]|uniref:mannose-specific lectin-like n=1 Tax=Phalaenopsis equestris TaxID=78828 RepID=UPI0009E358FA|nr:mannose-specific lectin-like [Phalaenopsis equestris]